MVGCRENPLEGAQEHPNTRRIPRRTTAAHLLPHKVVVNVPLERLAGVSALTPAEREIRLLLSAGSSGRALLARVAATGARSRAQRSEHGSGRMADRTRAQGSRNTRGATVS